MAQERNELSVDLSSIEELFAEPAADPFDPESRYQSGIDVIAADLRLRPLRRPSRIVVRLPRQVIDSGLEERTRDALDRYCSAKIDENRLQEQDIRMQGRRTFLGAGIAVILIGLAYAALATLVPMPDVLVALIGFWAGIAAWAIAWNPIDTLIFYWRPNRREAELFENIQKAELAIEALPGH